MRAPLYSFTQDSFNIVIYLVLFFDSFEILYNWYIESVLMDKNLWNANYKSILIISIYGLTHRNRYLRISTYETLLIDYYLRIVT